MILQIKSTSKELGKKSEGIDDLKAKLIYDAKSLLIKDNFVEIGIYTYIYIYIYIYLNNTSILFTIDEVIDMCKESYFEGMMEFEEMPDEDRQKWLNLIKNHPRVIVNTLSFYI